MRGCSGGGAEIRERRQAGYEGPRIDIQQRVPKSSRNILELGCSTGTLGSAIKDRQAANIFGVELLEEYATIARGRLDRVIVADAQACAVGDPPSEAPFDCLICADALEHLVDPWQTLEGAVSMLEADATVIVSVPNVFYLTTLRQAITSRRWPREDQGVFDRTHLRWFGPEDARELLEGAGLERVSVEPIYWGGPKRVAVLKALARTPLRDFLPAQVIATGVAPGGSPPHGA
jgi:predicted TPR repeat methyltransferase